MGSATDAAPSPAGGHTELDARPDAGVNGDVAGALTEPAEDLPRPQNEAGHVNHFRLLREHRAKVHDLPCWHFFELPGRPNVVWELRDYGKLGAKKAREELPFMFKAFEVGQMGPARLKAKYGDARAYTIHEYLDWTVTALEPKSDADLDFSGFRLLVVQPRFRPTWPPPDAYVKPEPRKHTQLGAPLDPLPALLLGGKPVTAATIRAGPNYLEVPFVATQETRRGRGWGRACVEAIEDVARCLRLPYLLLCSTLDPNTIATWKALGFIETQSDDLQRMEVDNAWLLHMDNTVQMHKQVQPVRKWRAMTIKHQHFRQRVYMCARRAGGPVGSALTGAVTSGATSAGTHPGNGGSAMAAGVCKGKSNKRKRRREGSTPGSRGGAGAQSGASLGRLASSGDTAGGAARMGQLLPGGDAPGKGGYQH